MEEMHTDEQVNEIDFDGGLANEIEVLDSDEQERVNVRAEIDAAVAADEPTVMTSKKKPISRMYLIINRTKLLCKDCGELRKVVDFLPLQKRAVLECSHRRGLKI